MLNILSCDARPPSGHLVKLVKVQGCAAWALAEIGHANSVEAREGWEQQPEL